MQFFFTIQQQGTTMNVHKKPFVHTQNAHPFSARNVFFLAWGFSFLLFSGSAKALPDEEITLQKNISTNESSFHFHEVHFAQQEARRKERMNPQERAEMKEKLQRKMHTYLTVELSELLSLDEKKAVQLSGALKRNNEAMQKHHQKMRMLSKALEKSLEENASEKKLQVQLKELTTWMAQRPSAARLLEETKSFLTVQEQSRLVLAYPRLIKEMRGMMQKHRKEKRVKRRRQRRRQR